MGGGALKLALGCGMGGAGTGAGWSAEWRACTGIRKEPEVDQQAGSGSGRGGPRAMTNIEYAALL